MNKYYSLYILLALLLGACGEDNNDDKNYLLEGNWIVENIAPTVWPLQGGEEEKIALEDSLTAYTFIPEGTEVIFKSDSLYLNIQYMGWERPATLAYHFKRNLLTITPPAGYPLILEGTVELDPPVMIFTPTTESYMTILQAVQPSFLEQILSATVTYTMQQ